MQPHHDRLAVPRLGVRRRPHVQRQAVVTLRRAQVKGNPRVCGLSAGGADARRIGGFRPPLGSHRCPPPQVPCWRRGVANPLPHLDRSVVDTTNRTVGGVNNRRVWALNLRHVRVLASAVTDRPPQPDGHNHPRERARTARLHVVVVYMMPVSVTFLPQRKKRTAHDAHRRGLREGRRSSRRSGRLRRSAGRSRPHRARQHLVGGQRRPRLGVPGRIARDRRWRSSTPPWSQACRICRTIARTRSSAPAPPSATC